MSIATPALTNFTAGEISPRLEGRVDLSRYFNGCRLLENFHVHPHGGVTRRSGFRFAAQAGNQAERSLLVAFEFNTEQTYVLEFFEDPEGQGRMRVFKDQGLVMDGETPFELDTPYAAGDFADLRQVQSNDTLFLVHPKHPPRKLTRSGHASWSLETVSFIGQPESWGQDNYPSVVCFFEERLVLAATPDRPNSIWFSRTGDYFDLRTNTRQAPLDDWDDLNIADANADGRCDGKQDDDFVLLDGMVFESGSVVKGETPAGDTRWFRYQGGLKISASGSDATVTFKDSPAGNQIGSVHSGAGALNGSEWQELSLGERIASPAGLDPLDDDGLEITLSSAKANAIVFMVSKAKLWVGTVGGEWTVGGASASEALSPSCVKASHEGTSGAERVVPLPVGYATLFVQRGGKKIREMAYRFESDAFVSQDLTILSEHITGPGVVRLAYAQEPDSLVYCLRSDGALVSLTYQRDQEVLAWARQVTAGQVEDIACVFNSAAGRDELWAVVKRQVNGQTRRFVEFMEAEFSGPDNKAAFFVDSGLTYEGPEVSSVSGLGHLAGEEVAVLADGAVQPKRTVSPAGEIDLDRPAGVVHVGLAYSSTLVPMRIEAGSMRGTAQSKKKRIVQVTARFHDTVGGKIGPDKTRLEPMHFRPTSGAMGAPPAVWSGDKTVKFPKGWDRDGLLAIVQDQPLPMTVLMVVPEVLVNE